MLTVTFIDDSSGKLQQPLPADTNLLCVPSSRGRLIPVNEIICGCPVSNHLLQDSD